MTTKSRSSAPLALSLAARLNSARWRALTVVLCVLGGGLFEASAQSTFQLKPFKDNLFRYPGVLEQGYDGAYVRVDYLKARDIWKRDEIPERRVLSQYTQPRVSWQQRNRSLQVGPRTVEYFALGAEDGARVVVIYLHGRNGSRHQGVNDYTFGGNFNRIKNLMARNRGLYISPDFTNFSDEGHADIKALVYENARRSPGAPIVVACGSMVGALCWRLAKDPDISRFLGGIMLLGSLYDDSYFSSAGASVRSTPLPIYLGHGTWDQVFDWQERLAFFERVKQARPTYPIRLAVFETGTHGTPIRMTDWRLTLNWMLTVRAGGQG